MISKTSLTFLNFKDIDALLALIEHIAHESWHEMSAITGLDYGQCDALYQKLSEMQDEI